MSDDALLIAEKIFRRKIKAINLYKSQGKKHPKLRKDDSIREFANACKASGMASSEISSDMKFRLKDMINGGMLRSESIDKALGPEFKNHNWRGKGRQALRPLVVSRAAIWPAVLETPIRPTSLMASAVAVWKTSWLPL